MLAVILQEYYVFRVSTVHTPSCNLLKPCTQDEIPQPAQTKYLALAITQRWEADLPSFRVRYVSANAMAQVKDAGKTSMAEVRDQAKRLHDTHSIKEHVPMLATHY
ncbi:hypothetical protein BaRGS_00033118 [Batillaria attramentaria]|uniref:Uncharacterized protein n=1 Tax=Batillaria attramentaria TaxID=370345 RepID=A0ABD0JKX9_9CAEN